jgi:hypothetical protein
VKSLSLQGHDKKRCLKYTEHRMNRYLKDTCSCGLCQCGVPCTDHVPAPEEG